MNTRERAKEFYPWANEDQLDCLVMHNDLMCGFHHSYGKIKASGENGILINEQNANSFATFDYDYLTKAVVLAHDRMIRFSISPSGPRILRLTYHKRKLRSGDMAERHPTIEAAIEKVRTFWTAEGTETSK